MPLRAIFAPPTGSRSTARHAVPDDEVVEPTPPPARATAPAKAPASRGNLLLGSSLELKRDTIGTLMRHWRQHGDVVRFRSPFSGVPDFLLAHPDAVKQVLQEEHPHFLHPPRQRSTFSAVVGQGLVASQGDYWRRQRRLAQPSFRRDRVGVFDEVTVRTTDETLRRWEPAIENRSVLDIRTEMMRTTLDVLARAMFGADWSAQLDELGVHVTHLLERTFSRMLSPVSIPEIVPTPMNRNFTTSRRGANAVVYSLIDAHRNGRVEGVNLLQTLLAARDDATGEGMTDEQVRDEVMAMLIAGHETVSTALTWTWYLLSVHPDVDAKVAQEVSRVCGNREPTAADLPLLDYTRRVLLEVMRLYPPLWVMGRMPTRDVEVGGYQVPGGSVVLLSQFVTHRHPEFWDNPEGFDPDRFLPERSVGRHRFAYFPFGGGPRKCIGDSFGLMEMPLLIARVVQRCRLELVPGHPVVPVPGISLRPANGMLMVPRPR